MKTQKHAILYACAQDPDPRLIPLLLQYQITSLKIFCYRNHIGILKVISDKSLTDRQELYALINKCREGKLPADYLFILDWNILPEDEYDMMSIIDQLHSYNIDTRTILDFNLNSVPSLTYKFKTTDREIIGVLKAQKVYYQPWQKK